MINHYNDCDIAANKIIAHVGKNIIISVPLGIGKPIGLLNALYRLAVADQTINLTIITALTLARPVLTNELEKRFIEPILERLLKDYEDPLYEIARVKQQLPKNINVIEFFLAPGGYLNNAYVQQHYDSSTYTNAARDAFQLPINVHAQQVAVNKTSQHYSLSCNSDLFNDAVKRLREFEKQGRKIAIVAEINANLPYMHGEAIVDEKVFSAVIDTGRYRSLFSIPRDELSIQDHVVGLYTSTLIKDDGCLQIGIGKLSNAVSSALILRHKNNDGYLKLLNQLNAFNKFGETISSIGCTSTFEIGLYASTEMLSDDYLELYQAGILKKKVYDHVELQKLMNSHAISDVITPDIINLLLDNGIINPELSLNDFTFLQQFGIFKPEIAYQDFMLILPNGEKISADLSLPDPKKQIIQQCLGEKLLTGKIIHAGFFVGSNCLYSKLNNLSHDERELIDMTSISRTNKLTWSPELLHLQRKNARFINSGLMLTLSGSVVSDGLKDDIEYSGVGGQFDFIYMSTELADSRSIINCRSVRKNISRVESNIVWEYPNISIPRFFRDIVVTEYGIADCRGKTDAAVIKAILNITDSRFQAKLLDKAKSAGKLESQYEIPTIYQHNYPETIEKIISNAQSEGYCLPYPFGSDLTDNEQVLARVLLSIKKLSKFKLFIFVIASLFFYRADSDYAIYLTRMGLMHVSNIKEYFYKKILKYAIYLYNK